MPNYMDLFTDSGFAEIASDAAFNLSDDAEWRMDLHFDAWPPPDPWLAGRYDPAGDNREWQFFINDFSNGQFRVSLGTGTGTFRGNVVIDMASGDTLSAGRLQLRVRLDADNGSSETAIAIFSRSGANIQDLESDADWTSEGSTTLAGVQSWKATANPMTFGNNPGGTKSIDGRLYRFIMWKSLDKTSKIADVDFTDEADIAPGATDEDEWLDAVSANNWVMQGTHETDWDYVREGATSAQKVLPSAQIRRRHGIR